jgi:methionyl-tRNA formyltransferase
MRLAGIVEIRDNGRRLWRALRRERARSGTIGLIDAIAYRALARVRYQRADADWLDGEIERLRTRYPAKLEDVPRLTVTDPNSDASRDFIASLSPDVIVARCKFILKPSIFELARHGSFALHPGICPEYRNAHGCFWALANRDLERVGMTVVKIDRGVDTGPALLHASCAFDEVRESHTRIQYRVVTENLDRIAGVLLAAVNGTARPIDTSSRASAAWGQPRLSTYLRWKRHARRQQRLDGVPAVP